MLSCCKMYLVGVGKSDKSKQTVRIVFFIIIIDLRRFFIYVATKFDLLKCFSFHFVFIILVQLEWIIIDINSRSSYVIYSNRCALVGSFIYTFKNV